MMWMSLKRSKPMADKDQVFAVIQQLKASEDARSFYDRVANKLISLNRRYKKLSGVEIVAIMARLLGVMIAQIGEADRSLAKEVALQNIELAIEKIHPPKPEQENAANDTAKNTG